MRGSGYFVKPRPIAETKDDFCNLFETYKRKIFFALIAIVKNNYDAEDLLQETALKGFRNFNRLKDRNCFNTWIMKIAINNAYDFLKKKRHTYDIDDIIIPYYDEHNEFDDILINSLNILNDNERIVVVLRLIEDIAYKDISKIVDRPVNTLKSVYKRALEKLKNYLIEQNYNLD